MSNQCIIYNFRAKNQEQEAEWSDSNC